jgi:basic membrane protein A and related proteins
MFPKRILWALISLVVLASLLGACVAAPAAPAPAAAPAAAATNAPAAAAPAKPFKVGLVHPSPITDSWSGLAWAGLKQAEKDLGAQIANVQVAEPAGYEKAFSDFGAQGYDVVIGHGYQYNDAAAKVAPQFPNTYYVVVNGSAVGPNLTGINTIPGYVEMMYAIGMAAGKMSKTHQCAAFTLELPATKLPMLGFTKGFESVQGNKCSLVTLNDQNDVGAAKEATLQAMSNGADIITANANLAGSGVWQAVAAQGGDKVFAVGTVGDVNSQAPKNMLLSAAQDVPTSIFNAVKAIKTKTIKPGSAIELKLENPGDDAAYPIVWNPDISSSVMTPAVKAEIQANIDKIKSGALKVPAVQ